MSAGVLSPTLGVARCGGSRAGCVLCALWAVPAAVLVGGGGTGGGKWGWVGGGGGGGGAGGGVGGGGGYPVGVSIASYELPRRRRPLGPRRR